MINFIVAIDGPAGSGKSSISKLVAKKRGFTHIDTGAMYRAVTLEGLRRGINLANEEEYSFLDDISVIYKDGKIFLNNIDVSKEIRTSEITNNVSTPSKIKKVRMKMVEFQRESGRHGKVLMDGRDIGTVVFPKADLKIYLTASAEERAKRRCKENLDLGLSSDYETILREIKERDYKDSHREISPLKKADDAILLDTTEMTVDEVVNEICRLIDERLKKMEEFTMESFDMKKFKVGDVVEGEVVSFGDDKTIYLDIHAFTEGTMHLDHYTKDKSITSFKQVVKIGDVIKCEVAKVTEENIYLSRMNQIQEENFQKLVVAHENNEIIEVYVASEVQDKGYTCKYLGIQLFMPKSMATPSVKPGITIAVKVIEAVEAKKRALVSRRIIEQEEYQQNRAAEYDAINVGDVLTGKIIKIEKYGAIVKFNYNQGLLKANQVAHEFVNINSVLTVGQDIEVKVIGKENGRIDLSRKALLKSPFELFLENHKVGQTITGKVVNKLAFGLLLEIAPNVKGLLHSSEYSHNPNDNFNNHVVIGDEVEVAILSIDEKKEKVSLSRKALMDNPWSRVTAKEGDLVDAKVLEVKENGLLVETLGVDGFVPQSEALIDAKKDLQAYYAKDDMVKAYIIEIKPQEWKLKLSIRKYLVQEERKSYEKYLEEEETVSTTIGDQFGDILKK